jgi:hypothetical protein
MRKKKEKKEEKKRRVRDLSDMSRRSWLSDLEVLCIGQERRRSTFDIDIICNDHNL